MWQLKNGGQVVAEQVTPIEYDEKESGWLVNGAVFVDAEKQFTVSSTETLIPLIGPIAFQMLFRVEELVAIDAAKDSTPAIRIFWKLLDDPRTDYVDRNLQPIKDMLQSLEQAGLLGSGRAQAILTGEVVK